MEKSTGAFPPFSRDRTRIEELTQQIRHLQIDSAATISSLHTQLKAEREKSLTLENALKDRADTAFLSAKLQEAEEIEKKLRLEIVKLTRKAGVGSEEDTWKTRANELETENFLISHKLHALETQTNEAKAEFVSAILAGFRSGKRANYR